MRYWLALLIPLPALQCERASSALRPSPIGTAPTARRQRSSPRQCRASSISAVVRARIRISPDMMAPSRHFSLPLPMKTRTAGPKTRSQRVAALMAAARWTAARRRTARVDDVGAGTSGEAARACESVMHDRCVESLREPSRASTRQRARKPRARACHLLMRRGRMRSPTGIGSTSFPSHAATS